MNWIITGGVIVILVLIIGDGFRDFKRDERLAACETALKIVSGENKAHAVRVIEELLGQSAR